MVISCTTCTESIVVPPHSIIDVRPVIIDNQRATFLPLGQARRARADQEADNTTAIVRAGVVPHLARMMMNRLVQALLFQRSHLMQTQETATTRVEDMAERLFKVQSQFEKRVKTYETRIKQLEEELAAKEEENRELMRTNFQLSRQSFEPSQARESGQWNAIDLKTRVRFLA
jgi:hypothetical protein